MEWTDKGLYSCYSCIVHHLATALRGHNPLYVQQSLNRMNSAIVENPHTKAAVAMALWDLVGKAADLPLTELWEGRRPRSCRSQVRGKRPPRASIRHCHRSMATRFSLYQNQSRD